jgi:exodeoxyribonuclease VII large subunit
VLTVSQLTLLIKTDLETAFPEVWVEGEMSNLRIPTSGHMYFSLKDEGSQIRAVMFRTAARHLKFRPEDGQRLLVYGRVSVYEQRGEYQIIAEAIEPKGIGALQLAFEQLKERLAKEGLFDPSHKRPLPAFPRCIGIVTSPTGAALRDILQVLGRRFAGLRLLIAPVAVQGETAAGEIARGIRELNEIGGVDVLIVGRGGGSLEDLWAFNEVDYTIADFVADLRAPTPSAAAEMVVRSEEEIRERITAWAVRLTQAVRGRLRTERTHLTEKTRILRDPRQRVAWAFLRVDDLVERLRSGLRHGVQAGWQRLVRLQGGLQAQNPLQRLRERIVTLDQIGKRLEQQIHVDLQLRRKMLIGMAAGLSGLSPLNILSRGYSIARRLPDMDILQSAAEARTGDRINLKLHKGELLCRIERVLGELKEKQETLWPA